MKAASLREMKSELNYKNQQELIELILRLSRFKKENKELLTYLLFEIDNEEKYIESIKSVMDQEFNTINTESYYYIRKSIRRILRLVKKFIKYSKKEETEVELLLYFSCKLSSFKPTIKKSKALLNIYDRNMIFLKKKILTLHEDLQYDYQLEIEKQKNKI